MTAFPGAVPLASARRGTPGSYARLLLVPLWTSAAFLLFLLVQLGPLPGRRKARVVRGWARGLLRILRIQVRAEGSPPAPPFLLVSNHLSYLDVIVLLSEMETVFVAKREVRGWPLFGQGARAIGCVFVDRDSRADTTRVGDAMRDRYQSGQGIVLFAEGTSTDGTTVLPLRTSLLEWPARDGVAVHTATLSYHTSAGDPVANQALCWWGDMTFLPHLAGVCRLGPSQARVSFGTTPVSADDRKTLAAALHAALLTDFHPSGVR